MKKSVSILLSFAILLSMAVNVLAGVAPNITVIIDDEVLEFETPPFIENDVTLVPMRTIFEALGAGVLWDEKFQIVSASKSDYDYRISIPIGSKTMTLQSMNWNSTSNDGDKAIHLDVPAQIVNDQTFVPLRAVSEVFNCDVQWDEDTKTITITSPKTTDEKGEYEISLLNSRLNITLPYKIEPITDYVPQREVEMNIDMPVDGMKLSIYTKELFRTSVGNMYKDATNLDMLATKLPVIKQNDIEILELASNGAAGDGAVYLGRSYLVKLDDDFLVYLEIKLNSSDIENEKLFNNLTDDIIKTLKRGERDINLEKGNAYVGVISLEKPEEYVTYQEIGADFRVYRIIKIVPSSEKSISSISIYYGGHPSYSEEYNGEKPYKTLKGTFLDEDVTWQLYKADNYMQTMLECNRGYYYIFACAESSKQQREFIDIVSSVRENHASASGAKPVIYLYPEKEQEVSVTLDLDGEFTFTYPEYNNGWTVTAKPDGTIISDSQEYSYLFWEGKMPNFKPEFKEGFVVKGSDSAEFLRETLSKMGLTPKEYNEFIVYWAPKLQENEYNKIYFAQNEYDNAAKLNITPEPDSVLRVFMVYEKTSADTVLPKQEIKPFERDGFTVVEWGGYLAE